MARYTNLIWLATLLQAVGIAVPTAEELLDKCTEALDRTHTSFITQSEIHIHDNIKSNDPQAKSMDGERDKFLIKEFRTDGERIKIITQMWGDFFGAKGKYARTENEKQYSSDTYNGDKRYDHVRSYDSAGRVTVYDKNAKESLISLGVQFSYEDPTSQGFGYLIGDIERFDRILKKTSPGKMSVKEEELNGTLHYVIDAKTNNGQYKIWVNPEKGYNFSKATVVREEGDIYFGEFRVEPNTSKNCVIENTEFKQVDGIWVPVKMKSQMNFTLPTGGFIKSDFEIQLTTIQINPDHDALDSFSIDDIENGAKAYLAGMPHIKYIWRDGELISNVDEAVIDDLDKMAIEIMAEAKSPDIEESSTVDPNTAGETLLAGSEPTLPAIKLEDLLKNYAKTMANFELFSEEAEAISNQIINGKSQACQKVNLEFRTDSTKAILKSYSWKDAQGCRVNYAKEDADYLVTLYDGLSLSKYRLDKGATKAITNTTKTANGYETIIKEHPGSALLGYFPKEDKRIDAILAECDKALVQADMDTINGSECYVVVAITKNDKKFRIWFDPAGGYNIVQAQALTGAAEKGFSFILSDVQLEQVDGVWTPMQARMRETRTNQDKSKATKCNYKRTNVVLKPVFNERDFNLDSTQ